MPVFDLRDLARKIETVAKDHPCYGQVHTPIQQVIDHISAIARCEEVNRASALEKPEIHAGKRVFCKGIHNRGLVLARMHRVCLVAYDSKHDQELRSVDDLEVI